MVTRGKGPDDACFMDLPNYIADDLVGAMLHALAVMNQMETRGYFVHPEDEVRNTRARLILTNIANDIAGAPRLSATKLLALLEAHGWEDSSDTPDEATECNNQSTI